MTLLEQAAALDTSVPAIPRLGVPALPSGEALHGVACGCISPPPADNNTGCPTSFPSPAALGSAFDPALWQAVGEAIGLEARALYNAGANGALRLFAPNINLARDPRWGRNQEVPGEWGSIVALTMPWPLKLTASGAATMSRCAGEDPAVVSAYAQAFISGLQGASKDAPDPRYMLAAATAKHAAV